MKVPRYTRITAMALLATLVLSGTGSAVVVPLEVGPFDFCTQGEYDDNFVALRRGSDITQGAAFGNTDSCAVNFKGSAGAAGDTWLTYANAGSFNAFNGTCVRADILINKFNNGKGGGLVTLLDPNPGGKGLFLLVVDNGNTDRLTLNTINPDNGKIVEFEAVPAGAFVAENAWYRLALGFVARESEDVLVGFALLASHIDPTDPNSPLDTGAVVFFGRRLSELGLGQEGSAGMAAWAKSAVVNTSMTNFLATTRVDLDMSLSCAFEP